MSTAIVIAATQSSPGGEDNAMTARAMARPATPGTAATRPRRPSAHSFDRASASSVKATREANVSSSQSRIWRLAIERLSISQCMPAPSALRNWRKVFGHVSASKRSLAFDDTKSDSAAVTTSDR